MLTTGPTPSHFPLPLQHTTTIYLNDQIAEYAKELTDRMPGNLKVAYFVNSGRWAGGSRRAAIGWLSGGDFIAACLALLWLPVLAQHCFRCPCFPAVKCMP